VPIGTYVITVDGTAYVADGIKKVTWQLKQSGAVIGEGKANGTNEWSVVLTNVLGRNNFYVTAEAESGTSIWATTTFVLNDVPTIVITSFPENVQTVIVDPTQRVAGTAASLSGISNVTYKLKVGTDVTQGTAVGTNAWYVDVICQPGKNKFKATAMSGSGKTNTAECALFLRNPNFRIRKVKVKERRVFIKTSDPTQGDVDSLTNGYGGVGYVMLGDYTMPLTNLYWKRKGQYNANYLLKDADGKNKMSIKGKAQKDKCIIVATVKKQSTGITNFLDFIAFETNIALQIQLDSYGVNTNVTLDAKGKYKWNGSWF
jgi:hypothetical protein